MNKVNYKVIFKIAYYTIAAFFFALCGFYISSGEGAYGYIIVPMGVVMAVAASINLAEYIISPRPEKPSPAVFAEGVTTVFISLLPIIEGVACIAMLPFVLELWELFSGSVKSAESLEFRDRRVKIWWLPLTIGVFEILAGVGALLGPFFFHLPDNLSIASVMLLQALGYIVQIYLHGK
ncbi:MAG: hypothetical protein J6Q85_02955 [Clostridia bacterium]|nr:hypothetical protein [Clostridia bacterium]